MKALRFEAAAMGVVAVAFVAFALLAPVDLLTRGAFVLGSVVVFCASAILWRAE